MAKQNKIAYFEREQNLSFNCLSQVSFSFSQIIVSIQLIKDLK